jgi:hypothetical protein
MQEFEEHYRCSNRKCSLKYNKCKYVPGPVDLHPHKHSKFSEEQKTVMKGTAILGVLIFGFMVMLGGI